MERMMIINEDCELVCINGGAEAGNAITSLLIGRESGMGIKLLPDGRGNVNLSMEDGSYKGKLTLKKCEIEHLVNYLSQWLEGDSWRA